MRAWVLGPIAAAVALIPPLAAAWQDGPALDPAAARAAAALFASQCASCHVVADPARESDRAWLAQVAETS